MKGLLKTILVRAQKEKNCTESFHLLRKYIKIMLVEIRTAKAILMKSQMEMRNMLLDNGEKVILLKWQRSWLKYVSVLLFCERYNLQSMKLDI